ncbi:MAG: alpha/beta hydrolase, partial [Acidimicrobiales bacterium]|nr:alpha/beta hydrolase [Acidimicrobiales bacterium]
RVRGAAVAEPTAGQAMGVDQRHPRGIGLGDPALVATCCRRAQLPALIDVLDDLGAYGELDRRPDPVAVPTVVVWGDANRVLSPGVGARLEARLAPEASVVLAGCGHLPMLEDAEAVTHLIEELLGGRLEAVAVAREAS